MAAARLALFGKDAEGSSKILLQIIQNRNAHKDLRSESILGLATIGIRDPAAALALLRILENDDESSRVRENAAQAFEMDKTAGQKMLPDLVRFLQRKKKALDENVKIRVLCAISELQPDKAAAATLAEFVDDEKMPAMLALKALARIGPEAKTALPKVMDAVARQRPVVQVIRDGIIYYPDEWEPILIQVFGRENAIDLIRRGT